MEKVISSVLSMFLFSLILYSSLIIASAKGNELVTSSDFLVMGMLSYYNNIQRYT